MGGIYLGGLGYLRWACGGVRMNCRYTDEELKEDVERTIGIRAKDIEQIQFCGLWHIRFRAFGTDFTITVRILMTRCIWLSRPGNGSNRKVGLLAGFSLFSVLLHAREGEQTDLPSSPWRRPAAARPARSSQGNMELPMRELVA